MIELSSLTCHYGEKTILDSLSLKTDTHLSILGANGSGKSTLAKAICNLTPYDGEISIDGVDIKKISLMQRAKLISYIPAKLEVYDPYISVEEFVLLSRFAHKKSFIDYSLNDKDITKDTLEFLKIYHLKDSAINSLSSGEAQIVLIASALVGQSKIIIFDEPTANLDPHNSKIVAQHIRGLKKYHQIILITHDLHLASYIDSATLFIKNTKCTYYEDAFFKDEILKELYGVEFNNLAVRYG